MRGALNEEQRAAVEHPDGPLLVLAGAGSGKTRVLVHRIAHLVETGAEPWAILAVTFTNKAAGEMRERLRGLLGPVADAMWIGTFHSTCARLLRRWGDKVGLTRSFAIFDDDDQIRLITRLLKDNGMEDAVSARTILSRIDRAKNAGIDPASVKTNQYTDEIVQTIYPLYQAQLARENAVDFNDLLLHVLRLTEDATVGPKLATTFRHVLVDEFQDTNRVQYDLVRAFAAATRNLTVVGDDDQSIYGWRGAEPRNLLDFQRDFPDAVLVKLEQNYRSTQIILDAANGVIAKNQDRLGKALWTDRSGGDPIEVVQTGDERAEGWQVASAIRRMLDDGPCSPNDIAILYRTNAQSRVLEEHLRAHKVPARVVGAVSFFERREVKDAVAYLRLVANPNADSAFERVVNVPSRGVGEATVDRVRGAAKAERSALLAAARRAGQGEVAGVDQNGARAPLGPAVRKKLGGFVDVIDGLRAVVDAGASIAELLIQTVERSGLRERLEAEDTPESRDRLANLAELVTIASDYDDETTSEDMSLDGFLERIALATPADNKDPGGEVVTLMTVHIAKGLEFPVVFITGLEDGLFPSMREREGVSEADALEEERRLAYVAITRAKERLILSLARTRRVWGEIKIQTPSRFLDDIPPVCLAQPLRARAGLAVGGAIASGPPRERRPRRPPRDELDQRGQWDDDPVYDLDADLRGSSDEPAFAPGTTVKHIALGSGRVVEATGRGSGSGAWLVVEFDSIGRKTVQAKWLERAP